MNTEHPAPTGDLAFVTQHIPDYRGYDDEGSRSDSDMRTRAFVGSRLSETQERLAGSLDAETSKVLEDVLMRCMFSDQVFVRKFEHARLDDAMVSALIHSDRRLIEFGERLATASAGSLHDLLIEVDKQFEYRRSPEPLGT